MPRSAGGPSKRRASRSAAGGARNRAERPHQPGTAPPVYDRFFRQIVGSMRNGVVAITRDGTLAVINDEAYRIFGIRPGANDIGRPFTEILHTQHDIIRLLASAFELSHLPNRAELRLKANGKVIGYTLSHVMGERGRLAGVALFFKDLTRVEQLEERERLRDRLAALGEMAAAIAHEVKNPLASIEVMAGLLRRQMPASRDAHSILSDIINEAKMANAIVLEVLEFVRPIRLQVERTSMEQVLHAAVTTAETKVDRGGIRVNWQVSEELPPIQGDQHQLCQLFTNLLTNAFEALNGQGTVSILAERGVDEDHGFGAETHAGTPTIVVEIADDGPGVPPELRDRIFSPFFTTKPQGSGLGLAIVRKIVDAHDGRIDVKTKPGAGTRFRVTLPLAGDIGGSSSY